MTTVLILPLCCPLCETPFEGRQAASTDGFGPLTTDLRRLSAGEDPLPSLVHTCPGCGFTAGEGPWTGAAASLPGDSAEAGTTRAALLARVRAELGTATQGWDAALRYEAAARCAEWVGQGALPQADHWLRAAWMHEDRGRAEDGTRCRWEASRRYGAALKEPGRFQRLQDAVVVTYLAGELQRRLGNPDQARDLFHQVGQLAQGRPDLRSLVALAERQATSPGNYVPEG